MHYFFLSILSFKKMKQCLHRGKMKNKKLESAHLIAVAYEIRKIFGQVRIENSIKFITISPQSVCYFQIVTPIERDLSMTLDRSLSIPYSIVGSVYTIAALLPDSSGSSLYILRRRQDPWNRAK